MIFPTELFHYIVSKMDGFERENMRLVCKMFNEFKFVISSKNPARDREVLLIDCNRRFYELFEYGHIDIIRVCYRTFGKIANIFYNACQYGPADFALYIYENHICGNLTINMNTALVYASMGGNIDIIRMLANSGRIDYDSVDIVASLKLLCRGNYTDSFEYLLRVSGSQVLMGHLIAEACASGNMDMVRRVMELPVRGVNCWNMALQEACRAGNMDIINLCIENGADNWDLGFQGACVGGHMHIMELMILKGATRINDIRGACRGGHMHIVEFIMKNNPINLKKGFETAVANGHIKIARFIATHLDRKNGFGAINQNLNKEMLEFLIECGCTIKEYVLDSLVKLEDLDIIKLLVRKGFMARPAYWVEHISDTRIVKYLRSLFFSC